MPKIGENSTKMHVTPTNTLDIVINQAVHMLQGIKQTNEIPQNNSRRNDISARFSPENFDHPPVANMRSCQHQEMMRLLNQQAHFW